VKWRCPTCGKPHERNDPPCDNCGHHTLERAVVPQPQAEESHEQFVWACSSCGRHHQRNNPPCSRCGGATFEKKPLEYGEIESPGDTPGYLELVGRQELAAVVVVVALVAIGVLGFLGVLQIPGITPQPEPTVEDAPGDPSRLGSVNLSTVEAGILTGIDDRRDGTVLQRSTALDEVATYQARRLAVDIVGDREPSVGGSALDRFDTPCNGRILVGAGGSETSLDGATAESMVEAVEVRTADGAPSPTDASITRAGIDAHALPDGRLVVVVAYC